MPCAPSIQHQVLQRRRGRAPDLPALRPQQQLVQHLAVGEQDVWRVQTHLILIINQRMRRHLLHIARSLAGVDTGRDPRQRWLISNQLGQPISLVIRQRIHWVQKQHLHTGVSLRAGTCRMVQHRVQEGLRLT